MTSKHIESVPRVFGRWVGVAIDVVKTTGYLWCAKQKARGYWVFKAGSLTNSVTLGDLGTMSPVGDILRSVSSFPDFIDTLLSRRWHGSNTGKS